MDIKISIGVIVLVTAAINGLFGLIKKLTRSDEIKSLIKFKTQMEIKVKSIEAEIEESKNSNSQKFNAIISEVKGMRTDISDVKVEISKIVGAWEIIKGWIRKNGEKK
jgi:hypothetical protein